ncbi:serine/threonine protein kinase [Bifidobacterium commune]|nr:serine/threonine protein kinase [Bifidobacterium commune]
MSDLNALDLQAGDIVGGYTLISRLGGGAMGSVWRVRDGGGEMYAMKILRDSLRDGNEAGSDGTPSEGPHANVAEGIGNDSNADQNNGNETGSVHSHHHSHEVHVTARERMRREAVAMRKINHPGVCAIVDMELDDSLAFIVTELIEGKNLQDDVAANGRYVGDDLQRLAAKLIDAVQAVHAQGIIHRDIKPTNVMISASGPVLVDFGIAMTEGESHVTRTGLVMGTPGFIAPEIIDGAESNEATDWWSLASVIAFAATGHPVFGSKPMMAVLEREASGNANLAGLAPNTLAALRSALNPDPSKRCSPQDLLQGITLDTLNPFENGELSNDESNDTMPWPLKNNGAAANNANTETYKTQEVMPPFGISPRTDSDSGSPIQDNPRSMWTDNPTDLITRQLEPAQRQPRDSTRLMAQPEGSETAPVPVGSNGSTNMDQTSVLPTSNIQPAQPMETGTMPLAMNLLPQAQPSMAPQTQPSVYASYPYSPANIPMPPAPLPEQTVNPADIRRDALISRSTLVLWLAMVPLALLAAAMPAVSLCCAAVLLWLLLTLGYGETSQLEREARRDGIRKRGDTALRLASLPWHAIKALLSSIPRIVAMVLIADLSPIVVNLVSGLPTKTVSMTIGSLHIPLLLAADISFSYSSASLAIFMAAAWLITVFGPRKATLRLGAGCLGKSRHRSTAINGTAGETREIFEPQDDGYADGYVDDDLSGVGENVNEPHGSHWLNRGSIMLILWAVATVAAAVLVLTNGQIDWIPLPNPSL